MNTELDRAVFLAWTLLLCCGVFDVILGVVERNWGKPITGICELYVAHRLIQASRKDDDINDPRAPDGL
jgi:hypothetical protein